MEEDKYISELGMKPISCSIKKGVTTYHYKMSELRKYLEYGYAGCGVGLIIIRRKGKLVTYKTFSHIYEKPLICAISYIKQPTMIEEWYDNKRNTNE